MVKMVTALALVALCAGCYRLPPEPGSLALAGVMRHKVDDAGAIVAAARQRYPQRAISAGDIVSVDCALEHMSSHSAAALLPPGVRVEPGDVVLIRVRTPMAFRKPGDFDEVLAVVDDPRVPARSLPRHKDGKPIAYPPEVLKNYVESAAYAYGLSCFAPDTAAVAAKLGVAP